MSVPPPTGPAPSWTIARRRLVALVALLVAFVVLWHLIDGQLPGRVDKHGAELDSLTIRSKAVGEDLPLKVVVPAGAADEERPSPTAASRRTGTTAPTAIGRSTCSAR